MKNHQIIKIQYFLKKKISFRSLKIIFFKKKVFFKNNLKFFKFFKFFKFKKFFEFLIFKKIKINDYFISPYKNNFYKKIPKNIENYKFFCGNYINFSKKKDLVKHYKNTNFLNINIFVKFTIFLKIKFFIIEYLKLLSLLSF